MRILVAVTTVPLVVLAALPAAAQPPQPLGEPIATFPQAFSDVTGIRELSDGRLLLADRLERHVSFIDFASGNVWQVGSEGPGPGEYSTPTGLLALPNDETLLVDLGNMRLTRIDARGNLGDSWPITREDGSTIIPTATDAEGHLYFSTSSRVRILRRSAAGRQKPSDSVPVQRWDPVADRIDTVAMLWAPRPVTVGQRLGAGASFTAMTPRPFIGIDAWGVSSDGRVVVARAGEYRLDWHLNGRVAIGPRIEYQRIRITDDEKEAWADRMAGQRAVMRVRSTSGSTTQSVQVPRPNLDEIEFPEYKPAFDAPHVLVTPWGEAWLERSRRHDQTEVIYDVFDDAGRRIKQIQLPEGRTLIGFGREAVFTVFEDVDGLQWVEKSRPGA